MISFKVKAPSITFSTNLGSLGSNSGGIILFLSSEGMISFLSSWSLLKNISPSLVPAAIPVKASAPLRSKGPTKGLAAVTAVGIKGTAPNASLARPPSCALNGLSKLFLCKYSS